MSTPTLFDRDGSGDETGSERIFRVAALNRAARVLLEDRWRNIWVEGELSDVSRAGSGHVYFTLNDEQEPAQLRGVMFRSDARLSRARLADGSRVKMRGTLSIFEPRGAFQLIARTALPQGLGDLHAQFERVRRRLMAEGLLDPERKRPLPGLPSTIGVVTSAEGAALHDVIRVAAERCPVRIVVAPCLVQGSEAPRSIIAALEAIQQLHELDVVIVGRGGGAAEDLTAFNDERVARSIANCRVPTISAVGHEVDITIADLVADVRAATPSNAAELCVPERGVLADRLASKRRATERAMETWIAKSRLRLDQPSRRLRDPRGVIHLMRRRFDAARTRLADTMRSRIGARRLWTANCVHELRRHDPRVLAARSRVRLSDAESRVRALARSVMHSRRARLAALQARLGALSPLAILARGYAIALHGPSGRALLRAGDAQPGDEITLHLHEGRLKTRVESS